jgi:hypothetical protein
MLEVSLDLGNLTQTKGKRYVQRLLPKAGKIERQAQIMLTGTDQTVPRKRRRAPLRENREKEALILDHRSILSPFQGQLSELSTQHIIQRAAPLHTPFLGMKRALYCHDSKFGIINNDY